MSGVERRAANAVILAAGKSSKFLPPLYDKPKGLFVFRNEVLIERQIRQLQEAGINDIAVVIGYEKERYFYLGEKFGVDLVTSLRYNDEGNLSSLEVVKDRLGETYVCAADHWYDENPFMREAPSRSIRLIQRKEDSSQEFLVDITEDNRISSIKFAASAGECMVGYAYFTSEFAGRFMELYEQEKGWLGVKTMHWELFWSYHALDPQLALYSQSAPTGFREFDSLRDFQRIDAGVLVNISQVAIDNICRLLKCERDDIEDIEPLNKGYTNVSFSFVVDGDRYVYRHPGAASSNLVNREAEVIAQEKASELGIDSTFLAIDRSGWKLSRYVETTRDFDYSDDRLLKKAIDQIKLFQSSGLVCDVEIDFLKDGDRLLRLASSKKGELLTRYQSLRNELLRLWHHTELDEVPRVFCHNDAYSLNWLVCGDRLELIDWEYAGMNDPVNAICVLVLRDFIDDDTFERVMVHFFDGRPTFEQRRHTYGVMALSAWYWFCWSIYKDSLGEDGWFMLQCWEVVNRYTPEALRMYECPESYMKSGC